MGAEKILACILEPLRANYDYILKDLAVEQQLEEVLDEHGIFYNKSETWIESEKLYEVLYTFEWEV